MPEQHVSDRLCGALSGFGDMPIGCQCPEGHTGPHKNRNGYEWQDRSSLPPEQDVSDRERLLEQIGEAERRAQDIGVTASRYANLTTEESMSTVATAKMAGDWARYAAHHALTAQAIRDALDNRQIALSYEAQIQAQDQQIGALRAEQARLRAGILTLPVIVPAHLGAEELWQRNGDYVSRYDLMKLFEATNA